MYYSVRSDTQSYYAHLSDDDVRKDWELFCSMYDIRYVGGEIRHAGEMIRSEMERRGLSTDVQPTR